MQTATWAMFGVSVVLALSAVYSGWLTRAIVARMDREREELTRPMLTFQLIPWRPKLLKLRIENVGKGPAIDVEGSIEALGRDGSVSIPWSYPILGEGRYEELGFPAPDGAPSEDRFNLDAIRKRVNTVRARLAYSSPARRRYHLDFTIAIAKITEDWSASRMMATEDHAERLLPRIAKAIEDIARKS